MKIIPQNGIFRRLEKFNDLLGSSLPVLVATIVLTAFAIILAVYLFFNSAAPTTMTMTTGPEYGVFYKIAEKYKEILARQGIKLKILTSEGTFENLKKLANPNVKVDVGIVQGGESEGIDISGLVSLSSISYQPLMIFYKGEPKRLLSEFKGQRLDVGKEGGGAHVLSLQLLKDNGIKPDDGKTMISFGAADPAQGLIDNKLDAVFTTVDTISLEMCIRLMHMPDIHLYSFTQAEAYIHHSKYLSRQELPMGYVDLGRNIPSENVILIGPTMELVARDSLHPALIDVLLEAAREIHSGPGPLKKVGEFPALQEHEFRISPDAARFYSTGKSFLYRNFPFWLASLISRSIAAIVPIVLLLIPGLKLVVTLYRWRMRSRVYRWYKLLFSLEREVFSTPLDEGKRQDLLHRLEHIENSVKKITVPSPFGEQLYTLKAHINFVRERLLSEKK